MSDHPDIFVEVATMAVGPHGLTMTLLRTTPSTPTKIGDEVDPKAAIPLEIAARLRFSASFALELRDLIDRILAQLIIPPMIEKKDQAPSLDSGPITGGVSGGGTVSPGGGDAVEGM
jgi:hypothetical protein